MEKKIVTAEILAALPNEQWRCRALGDPDDKTFLAYIAGKMKFHRIKLIIGDLVDVEMDPYHGKTTNRIVHRK